MMAMPFASGLFLKLSSHSSRSQAASHVILRRFLPKVHHIGSSGDIYWSLPSTLEHTVGASDDNSSLPPTPQPSSFHPVWNRDTLRCVSPDCLASAQDRVSSLGINCYQPGYPRQPILNWRTVMKTVRLPAKPYEVPRCSSAPPRLLSLEQTSLLRLPSCGGAMVANERPPRPNRITRSLAKVSRTAGD